MMFGADPRRPVTGLDVRRPVWSVEDAARLLGIVALHGGTVETILSGEAAVSLRWTAPNTSQSVCVSAPSGPEALAKLTASLAGIH